MRRERLGFGQALRHHGGDHEVGDAGRRLAGAEEQHPLVGKLSAVDPQRREQAGERHRRGALDVVIEDIQLVAIFVQQAERRVIGEILELDQHAGEGLVRRGDEFVDEFVVSRAGQAFLPQADIIADR